MGGNDGLGGVPALAPAASGKEPDPHPWHPRRNRRRIVLVLGLQIHPALLVGGLAALVAACTVAGNLLRGIAAYGTVLAGYAAAMVSLLDTAHPDRVLLLGADRLATVLAGVLVASSVGLISAPAGDGRSAGADIPACAGNPGALTCPPCAPVPAGVAHVTSASGCRRP